MNQWKMIFVLTEKGKTMTDYIKRDEALYEVMRYFGWCAAYENIKALPSADVAPVRHGKWNNHKDEHVCSICKDVVIADWTYDYDELVYDYCPHCGARMDGEK